MLVSINIPVELGGNLKNKALVCPVIKFKTVITSTKYEGSICLLFGGMDFFFNIVLIWFIPCAILQANILPLNYGAIEDKEYFKT